MYACVLIISSHELMIIIIFFILFYLVKRKNYKIDLTSDHKNNTNLFLLKIIFQ